MKNFLKKQEEEVITIMVIDQTDKALNVGSKTVNAVEKFMKAIEELRALEDERSASGLTLSGFDAAFMDSSLKHVTGADLDAVLKTSIPAIWTFMTDNNHDDNLQKARS